MPIVDKYSWVAHLGTLSWVAHLKFQRERAQLIYKALHREAGHIAWNPATSTTTMNVSDKYTKKIQKNNIQHGVSDKYTTTKIQQK